MFLPTDVQNVVTSKISFKTLTSLCMNPPPSWIYFKKYLIRSQVIITQGNFGIFLILIIYSKRWFSWFFLPIFFLIIDNKILSQERSSSQQLPFASLLPFARLFYFNVGTLAFASGYGITDTFRKCFSSTIFRGFASSSYLFPVKIASFFSFRAKP